MLKKLLILAIVAGVTLQCQVRCAETWPSDLSSLIGYAIKNGSDDVLGEIISKKLGFNGIQKPLKKIRFKASTNPDNQDRTFAVILSSTSPSEILGIEFVVAKVLEKAPEEKYVEGLVFFSTKNGTLKRVLKSAGPFSNVLSEQLPINRTLKNKFKQEIDFYLKDVSRLNLQP